METKPARADQPHLIQECMQSLRRIVKALENYSHSVEKRFDLTGPQLWALWEVGHSGPLALKDLAARMHLEPSTVVGVVDRLVAKDLLVRNPDPGDRRRISLAPTAKGHGILAAAPHPAQGHLLAGLASMESAQVLNLKQALATLEAVLEAEHLDAPFFFSGQ
jgi:DNA-binding MarR family transcriptional regulator